MRSRVVVGVVLASLGVSEAASAGERSAGSLTVETELALDPGWLYPGAGLGAAERLGATLFAKRFYMEHGMGQFWIDVGVGADFFHYASCYETAWGCSANIVFVPVGLRFGVGAVTGWSFVLDLGGGPYASFLPNVCGTTCPPGGAPSATGAFPSLSLGASAALGKHASLDFGVGIPNVYLGMAFL